MGKYAKDRNSERTSLLQMENCRARTFLLKGSSYCRFDLPIYFTFDELLHKVSNSLGNNRLARISKRASSYSDVNHTILHNKDGRYAWRPMQLIHPALYVDLVHMLTETENWQLLKGKLRKFSKNSRIACLSIPVEADPTSSHGPRRDQAAMVRQWWQEIEQRSIQLALKYQYAFHTDLADCYGSVYTHSIAWALHGKRTAKKEQNNRDLLGNKIDKCMRDMNNGQTNGVPQGSVAVDFIVELVLSYADSKIAKKARKAKIRNYRILRYRDDYRIFVNDPLHGHRILKIISEAMYSLGFKLNPSKTTSSDDVVSSSIKPDKTYWNGRVQSRVNLEKHILLIRELSKSFPESGSVARGLTEFEARVRHEPDQVDFAHEIISIVVDIALRNPRTYPVSAAIISNLLPCLDSDDRRRKVLKLIRTRFKETPNTGHLEIWLQRITHFLSGNLQYREPLCQLVAGKKRPIWNSEWICSPELKGMLNESPIVDFDKLREIDPTISPAEVDLFLSDPY